MEISIFLGYYQDQLYSNNAVNGISKELSNRDQDTGNKEDEYSNFAVESEYKIVNPNLINKSIYFNSWNSLIIIAGIYTTWENFV